MSRVHGHIVIKYPHIYQGCKTNLKKGLNQKSYVPIIVYDTILWLILGVSKVFGLVLQVYKKLDQLFLVLLFCYLGLIDYLAITVQFLKPSHFSSLMFLA